MGSQDRRGACPVTLGQRQLINFEGCVCLSLQLNSQKLPYVSGLSQEKEVNSLGLSCESSCRLVKGLWSHKEPYYSPVWTICNARVWGRRERSHLRSAIPLPLGGREWMTRLRWSMIAVTAGTAQIGLSCCLEWFTTMNANLTADGQKHGRHPKLAEYSIMRFY